VEHGRAAEHNDLSRLLVGRPGLISLLARWDLLPSAIPENEVRLSLAALSLDRDALQGCVHFNERAYQRNLIHFTDSYEVLVLCWRSGQRSPIHDHGESTCAVLVVEGVATETLFVAKPGRRLVEAQARRNEAGTVLISQGRDIHQVSNLEAPGQDLISLHVYSPRLLVNKYYRIDGTEYRMGPHFPTIYPQTVVAPLDVEARVDRDVVDPLVGG